MKKLFGSITALFTLLLLLIPLSAPQTAHAADIRTGKDVILSENQKNLKDLYLFGSMVEVDAPVTNDVVAAGGNVNLNSSVSNSVTAAGGTVNIRGNIGNTLRVAGGNVTIDGPVSNDVVVAGGDVTITQHAAIGGDLVVAGGQVIIDGPVHGKILMSGGNITLNNTVTGNVTGGHVGTLVLGPQALIKGNLSYNSPQPAQQEAGSKVLGKTNYHVTINQQNQKQAAQAVIGAALYRLLVGIIVSIILIYLFRNVLLLVFTAMQESPWKNGGIGLIYIILMPIVSLILLVLIWLGIAAFLVYLLHLILAMFIATIFVGWFLMRWWNNREKHPYELDWKAGIVGPIVLFVIQLIPIIGWLVAVIIYLMTLGALVSQLVTLRTYLQRANKKK